MTLVATLPRAARGRPRAEVLRPRECPRGHRGRSRIYLDAPRKDTDRHRTVMFRCVPDDGSPRHRFTWPDRMRWEEHDPNKKFHCAACEAAYRVGFGDHIGHRFDFSYRDIADLLLAVGRGRSFRSAASDLRAQARRWQGGIKKLTSREAQLAQSYVDAFAPLVLAPLAVKDWPAVVALDQLPFSRPRIKQGKTQPGGQEAGLIGVAVQHDGVRTHPILVQMMGGKDQISWKRFLTSLSGRPAWIVADRDAGLDAAVEELGWKAAGTVLYRCEAHLSLNAEKAAVADKLLEWARVEPYDPEDELDEIRRLTEPRRGRKKRWERTELFMAIRRAPESRARWNRLKRLVESKVPPRRKALRDWMAQAEPVLREQWRIRPGPGSLLPLSNGAVENSIGTIKKAMAGRGVQFGNLERLNKTLALICLQMAGVARRDTYEELIRAHFDATPGHTSQMAWRGYFDKGNSSIDSLIVLSRIKQAQITTNVYVPPALAKRKRAMTAKKAAAGLQPRPRRADGGGRKNYSTAGLMVGQVPVIGDEWHPTRNGGLDKNLVPASRRDRAWWRCLVDDKHEWEAEILSRCARRPGCPFCGHQRVLPKDSLAAKLPLITAEWHPTANGALAAQDLAPQSNKVVSWLCPNGHTYRRQVQHRTINGLGCPDPACKRPRKTPPSVLGHQGRRQRRIRRLAKASEDWLAGNTDATGLGPSVADTAALNAARANLERLLGVLDLHRLAALLDRSASTLRAYQGKNVPSTLIARRLAFLVQLAEALAPHGNLATWLERPHTRLGDQTPAELLLRETDWDPIKAGPQTLLMVAKQGGLP